MEVTFILLALVVMGGGWALTIHQQRRQQTEMVKFFSDLQKIRRMR